MIITKITNQFTGYNATIKTGGLPALSTLKKHLSKSKASDCQSVNEIRTYCDDDGSGGASVEVTQFGEVLINGRPA
jgi:hypothetical protein